MKNDLRPGLVSMAACLLLAGPSPCLADVNVAPAGAASQSSTANGGDAARAIDGNTDGNWGAGSVTHTDPGDIAPYWQVDLGKEYSIDRVVLWNRTDCCAARLTNFRISLLDDAGAEVEGENLFEDLSSPATPDFEWAPAAPTLARTVRIDKLGTDLEGTTVLSLAEVQAFSSSAVAPIITTQPRGGKAFVGKKFTFSVEAAGSEPFTYKWKMDGGDIPSATSSTLTLDPVELGDEGDYTVVVKNAAGETPSDPATLRVFNGRNLARDGEASQSTTGYGGAASRGIDGNTSGNYGNNSVTHTADGDPSPWWEVILFAPSAIDRIFIWNRTDCCADRLNNLKVLVLDADRNEVWSDLFFGDGTFPDTALDGFEIALPAATAGQVVRVEHLESLNGSPLYLSLAEVEVIGDGPRPPPDPNLARREGASAAQSSEYNGGQFPARNAIDGILDNFTHTGTGQNLPATWEVDLGAENDIEEIVIWNRRDCCQSRLRDLTVSILSLDGSVTLWESDLLNPENEQGVFPGGPAALNVNLFELTGSFVKGGRVRVVREPDPDLSGSGGQGNPDEADVLSLAEVQVFTPVECPPAGDTHCLPFFFKVEGPAGGGPGPYAVKALGRDDSGDAVKYTFTADNGRDPPIVAGPQASPQATLLLGVQTWTVSVAVDDNLRCDDAAADATCSKQLTVEGKPNNKAPFGVATQSSEGYGGFPGRAIDGITDGNYGNGSVSHTADGDPEPWWEVELEQTYALERIVIWNRTDCCPERLTNFHVGVLAQDRTEVHGEDFFTDFSFPDTTVDGFEVPVPPGTEGRTVRVALLPGASQYLSLAEVEVFCATTAPREDCCNGVDDDGDSKIDFADEDCGAAPDCGSKPFHRGDADDNGQLQLTDAIRVLGFLFLGQAPPTCMDAADADDNGQLQLTDAIRILGYLFLGGAAPAPPGPPPGACGPDATPDKEGVDLGCLQYTHC